MSWAMITITPLPRNLDSVKAPSESTKQSSMPIRMPGMASGISMSRNSLPARGAEIERRLARVVRHLRNAQKHREQHERQIDVDDAEQHGRHGVERGCRCRRRTPNQAAIREAPLVEEQHPAHAGGCSRRRTAAPTIRSVSRLAPAALDRRSSIGERIADHQQDRRRSAARAAATSRTRCRSRWTIST